MHKPKRPHPIRSRAQATRLPLRSRVAWRNALEVLALMRREDRSLAGAARSIGTHAATVLRYVGVALKKDRGQWVPTPFDRLYRPMLFPTPQGVFTLDVTDSRTASRIADYWVAVDRFLRIENERILLPFRGRNVRAGKMAHPFITDPATLHRLEKAGEVEFQDLYATTH